MKKGLLVMSLKSFVNNKPEWDAFVREIDTRIDLVHRNLEQANTLVDIHRAQGSIITLRQLKFLRDKANGPKG